MARTTDSFFALIEETFDVDTITPEKIMDKFYSGTFGDVEGGWYKSGKKRTQKSQATRSGQSVFMGLAERLSEGREVVQEIKTTTDFDELRKLKNRARGLDIYSKEVTERAEDKMSDISKELEEISKERKEKRIEEEKERKLIEREERREIKRQELEIAREIAREETIKGQEASRLRKEKLREKGIEPDF